ncbi:MAG: class I SAM-dependent methyltransferase [Lachnospiraceae bacterium]|jgi:ubiquinone/menaquinone biosynthesis C-methylase UbiE|nr:class I SAM-dependent methyltransferase [Lachnospiraceae bacterium]
MYQEFAKVYDEFMQTIPYTVWADYIEQIWKAHKLVPELVLDLACGTGSLTLELAKRGYDMIGADISPEMLEIAQGKARDEHQDILYLMQDMREFELYGTVDSILCTCDSINYILDEEELLQTFELVENYLDPGGLFVFDINTAYKYEQLLGDQTFADTTETAAFIWQNYYDSKERLNEYQVTFFYQQGELYQREEELHYQKAYTASQICNLLEASQLKVEAVYDAFTLNPIRESSERICFVAREQRKEKKKR